ncbi:MAG TPA: single-stranded DNA-binding protein [Actinomycetota bacterium]|nr:single-stranded DNA-binding protein [Actinomycetota bacterium]
MASDNTITLVGNITDDPELRFTPSGAAVANFTVAVNRRFKNGDRWEDKLDGFFRCSCWRDMAENAAESLRKGTRVVVVGRLSQRSWEDQEGNKRSAVEVQVDEVAPSLKWATASIQKSQRSSGSSAPADAGGSSGSGGGAGGGGGADWSTPAPVGGQQPPVEGGF